MAFLTEIGIIFWFKNAKRVLDIPIPEINIVQIEINDKNCEKLSIKFLMPIAEFPGKRILKFFSLEKVSLTSLSASFIFISFLNLTLYS